MFSVVVAISIFFIACLYASFSIISRNGSVTAFADNNNRSLKWKICAIDEGTTVNAAYLWPDEINPSFTSIYRDGRCITEKMVTITQGSVYHFRGVSERSVLYTEVYVGTTPNMDAMGSEAGTWYRLLPSAIREGFEAGSWSWEIGQVHGGRVYFDPDNTRILINDNDPTAVLYGMGLYLDNSHGYSSDAAFMQEGVEFEDAFGNTTNLFASALEYYYTKGGELRSKCPKIYAMAADVLSQLDAETVRIREDTVLDSIVPAGGQGAGSAAQPGPVLMTGLLEYVNTQRESAGLQPVILDSADDDNIAIRAGEVSMLYSQVRPDGTDAFSAYTDAVMCEIRFMGTDDVADIFDCASSYFLSDSIKSFNCAVYDGIGVLIFVW